MSRTRPFIGTLALAASASEAVRLSGWKATLRICVESSASPAALARLVRDVEREPELVPGVRCVIVLARGGHDQASQAPSVTVMRVSQSDRPDGEPTAPDGWVRYEVHGARWGVPWTVRFHKLWEGDTLFLWWSEGGTGCPDHSGSLSLTPHDAGTRLELWAETRSAFPLLGGAATLLVNPLFLKPAFEGWLCNLARAAG
jgi:hypothetical protein